MLSIFSCACWPSVCLFWKNVYSGLLPIFKRFFFFLILSCMRYLYILDINPLLVISFANSFSHSAGCLFVLLMVSFAVQKLLSLIRSHWFCFLCHGRQIKKILIWFMSKTVLPIFSSRSYIVSGLTFRSLIHFEFILYMVWENVLISFFYMYLSSIPSITYWIDYLFSIVYSHLLCHTLIDPKCVGWFLSSLFCSTDICVCFCATTTLFWLL